MPEQYADEWQATRYIRDEPHWLGQVWQAAAGNEWRATLAYYPGGGDYTQILNEYRHTAAEAIAAVDAAIEAGPPE